MEQNTINSWETKTTVKKGNIGEKIAQSYLERKGFIVYRPNTPGSHPFDNLCANDKNIFVAEIKTKEARKYYADTGVDIRHYDKYLYIKKTHNVKVYIIFVDAYNAKIYGNELNELIKPITVNGKNYPSKEGGIIYFPLVNMITIANLTKEQCAEISGYNTKQYNGATRI